MGKIKTKKQPEPIGRVMHGPSAYYLNNSPVYGGQPFLVVPMTKNGKCQRARVVEEMAKAHFQFWNPNPSQDWNRAGVIKRLYRKAVSAVLTRLGWPEDTKGGE